MAKTTPTTYSVPTPQRILAGRPIRAEDWLEVQQAQHYLYSQAGARCPLVWRSSSAPWTTTSATYTQTDESLIAEDLDRYQNVLRVDRKLDLGSGNVYRIDVRAWMEDMDLQVQVYDTLSNTLLGTVTLSQGAVGLATQRLDLTAAQAEVGGEPRVLLLMVSGGKTTSTTGKLWLVEALETVASASQLP